MDPKKLVSTRESPTFLNTIWDYKIKTFQNYGHWVWSNERWNCKDGMCWLHHCYQKKCYEYWLYRRLCIFLVALTCNFLKQYRTIIQKLKITNKYCEKYYKIICYFWWQWDLVSLVMTLIKTTVLRHQDFFKNLEIILLENRKGINSTGISATLTNYKRKQFSTNTKISPTTLIWNTKNTQGIKLMGLCAS